LRNLDEWIAAQNSILLSMTWRWCCCHSERCEVPRGNPFIP